MEECGRDPTLTDTQYRVDGRVYELKDFIATHPGGEHMISLFGGRDATYIYHSYHKHEKIHKFKPIRVDAEKDQYYYQFSSDFAKLRADIGKIVGDGRASWRFWAKMLFIMTGAIGVELYQIMYGHTILMSIILGFFWAWIGLDIQHDANHGAVSANGRVNRYLGYCLSWGGVSSIGWRFHHDGLHHTQTNDLKADPDLTTAYPLIRTHWSMKRRWYHAYQQYYTWILLLFLTVKDQFTEFDLLIQGLYDDEPLSKMARQELNVELAWKIFALTRFFVLPMARRPTFHTFLCLMITTALSGLYLGFFFLLSHNFIGVEFFNETKLEKGSTMDWVRAQVESSCNFGYGGWCFVNGGLNYQIEHHLFPRISHEHYPKIAPLVRKWCEERGFKYVHYPTLSENFVSLFDHLRILGNNETLNDLKRD